MYKVKLSPYRWALGRIFARQTPGHTLLSRDGRYRFYIDEEVEDPDFWVVQSKGVRKAETTNVAPDNTILLTTEPRSVFVYPDKYMNQFGMVCTCQEKTHHKHLHFGPAVLPWFVGFDESKEDDEVFHETLDYDKLQALHPTKKKLISVITSNKAFSQGHIDRIRFVNLLKAHFGDQIDVFGRGFKSFGDKWDVLADYKYHIVIENSSQLYYWTEKLGDCYLAETYPFYYGCTNLSDYFPEDAYTAIDIKQPEEAIRIIEAAIKADLYEQRKALLTECKQLCMDKYNMFDYIAMLCDQLNPEAPKQPVTIQPCKSGDSWINLWRYLFARTYYKWKNGIVNRNVTF